tara:strand:+ start:86 stop:262 length:177 start_codon:yes stop_codon:yes gene_type:complete
VESGTMSDEDNEDLGLFEQLDEALEEREQSGDRRKKNLGIDLNDGTDRRKSDRRLNKK